MLRLWTRHSDGTGPDWGVVAGRGLAFETEAQGNEVAARYRKQYPLADFYVGAQPPQAAE